MMIRKHENAVSIKAGILAIAVHLVLFVAMIVSINWKAAHAPINVTEVELWDKLPAKHVAPTVVPTPAPEPKPEVKEEPKPEPKPIVEEKPKEVPPKVDIELEKKKKALEQKEQVEKLKALEEKKKKEELEKIQKALRDDALQKAEPKKQDDQLKKIQQEMLSDSTGKDDKKASAAVKGLVDEYSNKIKAKIRGNVNKSLCGNGNPELKFNVDILPTGDLASTPKLVKSSGNATCDDAVERAIMASQPLPLPQESAAKAQFRNLLLTFKPNDE
jgi:colicin import membrane protein